MFMNRFIKIIGSLAIVGLLGACASGVTRMDSPATGTTATVAAPMAKDVKAVTLWLNADAKKLVADNLKFNQDTLRNMVERGLQAQALIKPESAQSMDIEITGFRTRSAFTAIMFGFMAGSDNVEGIVTIKGADGKVLKRAKVAASYALGGIAGGMDDSRMNWLYEEFSKHAVAELAGAPAK
jgi:Domain of unknown function (DUF4410)